MNEIKTDEMLEKCFFHFRYLNDKYVYGFGSNNLCSLFRLSYLLNFHLMYVIKELYLFPKKNLFMSSKIRL